MEPDPLQPLRAGLAELHRRIPLAEHRAPAISGWSVGGHISHCALVDGAVLRRLLAPTPPDPGLQPAGRMALAVLASGTIRRGLAKAPEAVQPAGIDAASLVAALLKVGQMLEQVEPGLPRLLADPDLLRHPLLGGLDRRQCLRVLDIHQRHHLAIINDISTAIARDQRS